MNQTKAAWTVMVYLAGDNNLTSDAVSQQNSSRIVSQFEWNTLSSGATFDHKTKTTLRYLPKIRAEETRGSKNPATSSHANA